MAGIVSAPRYSPYAEAIRNSSIGTATRRTPNRSVAAPMTTVEMHNAAVATRLAVCTRLGGIPNNLGKSEGVIKITTTMAAVSIHVVKSEVTTARVWLFRTTLKGNSRESLARFRISSNNGVSLSQRRSHIAM